MPVVWVSRAHSNFQSVDSVNFANNAASNSIVNEIKKFFCINKDKLIRLRRQNGIMLVIDKNLPENSKKTAYILETYSVCKHYDCEHRKSSIEVWHCIFKQHTQVVKFFRFLRKTVQHPH